MKLFNKHFIGNFKGIALIFLIAFSVLAYVQSLKEIEGENKFNDKNTENSENEADKKHKKKLKKKSRTIARTKALNTFMTGTKNDTLINNTYAQMNITFIKKDVADFKNENRNWDLKMIDKELEEIFSTMLDKQSYKTVFNDRAYMKIFLSSFYSCDKDRDNLLSLNEFKDCMKNDTYLSIIKPPPVVFAAFANYTNPDFFYNQIFQVLDVFSSGSLNFHAYMELRLMIFSWKKCSVVAPFIEETSWECAIEIVAGFKTSSRTILRNTFYMCLELANSKNIRNIDFVSYLMFASSARLYGRINGKMDHDVTSKLNILLLNK